MDHEIKKGRYELNPIITEKRVWNQKNILIAILSSIFVVIFEFVAVFFVGLLRPYALFLGFVLIIIYAIFLFFLLEPKLMREIIRTEVISVERPVIKEIVKEVPRDIVREVQKPVTQTLTKTVYVPIPRKKLEIPKYDYVGSSETKTFHTRNCRFGKLIKRKYKVSNNSKVYFTGRKYAPCKVCILKQKKA